MAEKTSAVKDDQHVKGGVVAAIRRQAEQSLAFASLVIIFAFFAFANSSFYSWSNISGILLSTAVTGMLAIGTTFVIITGGIDLSVGTGTTLTAVMTAYFLSKLHMPLPMGIVVGLVTGALGHAGVIGVDGADALQRLFIFQGCAKFGARTQCGHVGSLSWLLEKGLCGLIRQADPGDAGLLQYCPVIAVGRTVMQFTQILDRTP